MQIYPILYKPKYNPKSSFKPTNSNSQSAFRFHKGVKMHDKSATNISAQIKSKRTRLRQNHYQHASIKRRLITSSLKKSQIILTLDIPSVAVISGAGNFKENR